MYVFLNVIIQTEEAEFGYWFTTERLVILRLIVQKLNPGYGVRHGKTLRIN